MAMSDEQTDRRPYDRWKTQPTYSPLYAREVKGPIGLNEAGWQPPSEADSFPRGELEGDGVDYRR